MKCTSSSTRTVFAVGVALALATAWLFTGTAAAHASKRPLSITSSLAGKKVLPHRIHWLAVPKLAPSKVKRVEFLIDGRTRWIEHSAPYSYGYDGNYLVTSWLAPGKHRFKVRMTTTSGRRATSRTAVARVRRAAAPPRDLAGSWQRTLAPGQLDGAPAGTWTLSIDKVGWRVVDPQGQGGLVDVAYQSAGLLEVRGGIRTKPNQPGSVTEGNGFCDEPFEPVRYSWAAQSDTLTLALAGPPRCGQQSILLATQWSRVR
jgi:hypothetical protein